MTLRGLYAADLLRADGYPTRFARLDMLNPSLSPIFALCWAMEVAVALAFLGKGKVSMAGVVAFWFAYLAILHTVA